MAVTRQPGRLEYVLQRHFDGPIEATTLLSEVPGCHRVSRLRCAGLDVVTKQFIGRGAVELFATLQRLATEQLEMLAVPEPLFCDADAGLVVMANLPGQPYPVVPSVRAMGRAGRALAELHTLPVLPADRVTVMADHRLELIRPAPAALSAALPQWARVVEESLSMLSSMSEEVVPVLLHRDFHLRQCLADNERVGVVDWDLFAAGDPAFDVAYFTTYLETHGLGTGLADAFLAGYAHGGGPEVEPRLGAYRGFNLLRRACRRFRLHDAGWEREMSRMLASLETALP